MYFNKSQKEAYMNFKNIDFKSINKHLDLAVLGVAALSALTGSTNSALFGIIVFLIGTVLTRDSK